jgi:hypothetical protein
MEAVFFAVAVLGSGTFSCPGSVEEIDVPFLVHLAGTEDRSLKQVAVSPERDASSESAPNPSSAEPPATVSPREAMPLIEQAPEVPVDLPLTTTGETEGKEQQDLPTEEPRAKSESEIAAIAGLPEYTATPAASTDLRIEPLFPLPPAEPGNDPIGPDFA